MRVSLFLFAVARDVQRNRDIERYAGWDTMFLFAVARDVQRNDDPDGIKTARVTGFYSLSRETYNGTCPATPAGAPVKFLFAVTRDVQRNYQEAGCRGCRC